MVNHQHRAVGKDFKASFIINLQECAEPGPRLINAHTGRDYFTFAQNLELVDIALEFSAKTGIRVAHQTHRGRLTKALLNMVYINGNSVSNWEALNLLTGSLTILVRKGA